MNARLEGTRVASTFTGFCSFHDADIFRPLESGAFTGTPQQCLLLAYRSTCRELYAKQGTLALEGTFRELDRGKDFAGQRDLQERITAVMAGTSLAVTDLRNLKESMEASIVANDFTTVHSYILLSGCLPEIMVSAMLNPEHDFNARFLQSLASPYEVQWVSFSLIATDVGGAAVFTWLGQNAVAEQLIDSLDAIQDDEKDDAIVRFAFEMTEYVYASPAWWEALSNADRAHLLHRMETGGIPVRQQGALLDDGLRVIRWPVISRVRF